MIDLMVYRAEGWTVRNGGDLYAMRATYAAPAHHLSALRRTALRAADAADVADMRTLATAGTWSSWSCLVHLSLRLLGRPPRASRPAAALLSRQSPCGASRCGRRCATGRSTCCWPCSCCGTSPGAPGTAGPAWASGSPPGSSSPPRCSRSSSPLCGVRPVHARLSAPARRAAAGGTRGCARPPSPRGAFLGHGTARGSRAAARLAPVLAELVFAVGARRPYGDHRQPGPAAESSRVFCTPASRAGPGSYRSPGARLGLGRGRGRAPAGPRRLPYAPAWAAVTCARTALLVSPVSWSHHWVWCVPVVHAARRGGTAPQRAAPWLAGRRARRRWSSARTPVAGAARPAGPARPELTRAAGEMLLVRGSTRWPALGFLALTRRGGRAGAAQAGYRAGTGTASARWADAHQADGQGGLAAVRQAAGVQASGSGEGVEALQRAVLVQQPPVDGLSVQLTVGLDRVALYDQRPRAVLAPVLVTRR